MLRGVSDSVPLSWRSSHRPQGRPSPWQRGALFTPEAQGPVSDSPASDTVRPRWLRCGPGVRLGGCRGFPWPAELLGSCIFPSARACPPSSWGCVPPFCAETDTGQAAEVGVAEGERTGRLSPQCVYTLTPGYRHAPRTDTPRGRAPPCSGSAFCPHGDPAGLWSPPWHPASRSPGRVAPQPRVGDCKAQSFAEA